MKRNLLFILATLFISIGIFYLQFGRQPTVNHSMILKDSDHYDLSLVITLNKLVVLDQKNVERILIRKTLDNDFENIHFSYDVYGMPRNICVTVYANSLMHTLGMPAFQFQYVAGN